MSLTDEQVVRRLAGQMGWKLSLISAGDFEKVHPKKDGWTSSSFRKGSDFKFLTSLDALTPVLAALTAAEWNALNTHLEWQRKNSHFWGSQVTEWLLTMPAHTLAHAIAEIIPEPK